MSNGNTFGARLIRAWADMRLDPSVLASAIGKTPEQMAQGGTDKSPPSMDSMRTLAATLSVDPGWLIHGDDYYAAAMMYQMREQTELLREIRDMARAQAANPK
ncbi:hypothetical protein [Delftia acidovorans]|uniref:hypothetical protein n=1 Tax=Delftia acidovorans TaxID=80866 RepID=UPI000BD2522B|nr:hypothetical protein [Delftia acidovorans]SOE35261.1 hypothetical protein SAMN05216519_1241 [Delftia acidovorans]